VFEVSVDGKEIWSKQKSGKFPDEQALLRVVTTGR
jgi:selT/selW/selH-like putative selenoprotein